MNRKITVSEAIEALRKEAEGMGKRGAGRPRKGKPVKNSAVKSRKYRQIHDVLSRWNKGECSNERVAKYYRLYIDKGAKIVNEL